ncbi:unnamed protein product [Angiostrongylus costaricensis]|uniref:Acyl_transf_3 domain-containing protein n=1 Tax=Angiostrongylus costaricensis TaxID=334426 RepID=A0A0R3PH68_ANGCS|nr:unnamed protein product [Angiostrongylus costaricensis]
MTISAVKYRSDLQGIRALAITAVLLFHFYPLRFPNGHIGVDQFFVLSGFLMSMMFEREKHLGFEEVACFYYRRARRILPSYLLVILLSLIASHFILSLYLQASNWESAIYALMLITNIEAAESIRDYLRMLTRTSDLFTRTWSICLEMQFYFIFPLIFLIYKSMPFLIANLFLIIVGKGFAFNMVHARLWQFILGKTENSSYRAFSVSYLQLVRIPLKIKEVIVSTFLTAGLIHSHPTNYSSILSSKYTTYVGKLSYSLYLVHWPIYTAIKMQKSENALGKSAESQLCNTVIAKTKA